MNETNRSLRSFVFIRILLFGRQQDCCIDEQRLGPSSKVATTFMPVDLFEAWLGQFVLSERDFLSLVLRMHGEFGATCFSRSILRLHFCLLPRPAFGASAKG